MQNRRLTGYSLLGAGISAAALFAALATRVARHETAYADGRVRARIPKRRRRHASLAARLTGPLGNERVHAPAALATALWVWRRRGLAGALPIGIASLGSASLSRAFDRWLPHRSPPPGRHQPTEPSFPSGHSLETAAVSLTAAWVLARERLMPPMFAFPLALSLPIASGVGRIYLDRHWASDVAAGWLIGGAVAAFTAAGYEAFRPQRPRLRRLIRR